MVQACPNVPPQNNRYDVNRISHDVNGPHVPARNNGNDVNGLGLPTLAHTEQWV